MNKTGVRRCFVHKSLASLVQRLLLKTQAAKGKAHKGCCHGSLSKLPRFLRSSRSTPPGTRRPRTAVRHREPLRALLWHVRCRPATSLNLNDAGPAGPAERRPSPVTASEGRSGGSASALPGVTPAITWPGLVFKKKTPCCCDDDCQKESNPVVSFQQDLAGALRSSHPLV